LPELRGAPGRGGRSGRADDGVSEHRQGLDATIALWMGASSPVLPCAPPLASGWTCCRVHGCLRGRHRAAAGWAFKGSNVGCAVQEDAPAEWPRPRPRQGRPEGTRKLFRQLRGCFNETTFQQRLLRACRGLGVEVSVQHRRQDHRQLPGQGDRRALEAEPCCATIKTGHPATICHTSDGGAVSGGQAGVKPEAASGGSPKG
jgi:hypothetical protein